MSCNAEVVLHESGNVDRLLGVGVDVDVEEREKLCWPNYTLSKA